MPRAYTKSGSIEKYESSQWSTPTWSGGATGSVTGPDSNGNYTVNAPARYTSDSSGSVSCTTNYAGKTATFRFSVKITVYNVHILSISTSIIVFGWNTSSLPGPINVTVNFSNGLSKTYYDQKGIGWSQTNSIGVGVTIGTQAWISSVGKVSGDWTNISLTFNSKKVEII